MNTQVETKKIDLEWMSLIIEAKKMGLSRDDVRSFFQDKKVEKVTG